MKKSLIFLILIFQLSLASAQLQVQLNIKDNFNYGGEVYFEYSFSSSENIENLFYTPYIYCEGSPQPLLNREMISLNSGQIYSQKYIYGIIDNNYYSGKCIASISVEQPYQQNVEKEFTITSKKDLKFSVKTCKDALCKEPAKIFEKGDLIYFVYDSDYNILNKETLIISAKMIVPETKTEQEINLVRIGDSAKSEYLANQIGTYEIDVETSANGYKTKNLKYQFGVIENQTEISLSPPLEKESFFMKLKNIFLNFLGLFYPLGNSVLTSPNEPVSPPKINLTELDAFKQQYVNLINPCFKPKNILVSDSVILFNQSVLSDSNILTKWDSGIVKSAYLYLSYSAKCNFSKLKINFGLIPSGKKATIKLTCLDNSKKFYSSDYDSLSSDKSVEFSFNKQSCSGYRINLDWQKNYQNDFNLSEIKFS